MKYKLFGLIMIILMIFTALLFNNIDDKHKNTNRYHQHLEDRKESSCVLKEGVLCTHLPIIKIDTNGLLIPGERTDKTDYFGERIYTKSEVDGLTTIESDVSIIDNKDRNNYSDDKTTFNTVARIRIRGHISRAFDKKQYKLTFIDKKDNTNNAYPVMGMDSHHEWALYGPFHDASLIRNYMWYNIAGEIMNYAPNVRYCELILNGEYKGLYLMTETITNGDNSRLDLRSLKKGSEFNGYLLRYDRPSEKDLNQLHDIYTFNERMSYLKEDTSIIYPGSSKLTEDLARKIELDYSSFEKSLYSYDHDTSEYGFWNWIDVDNFIEYFILNEASFNTDAGKYSVYMYKEIDEKLRLAVWDFNDSCGNSYEKENSNDFCMVSKPLYFMLFKDHEFADKVIHRYLALRKTYLSNDYLDNYINQTVEYLSSAIDRNYEVWKDEMQNWKDLYNFNSPVNHEDSIKELKTWLFEHLDWLDRNINSLKAYSHFSRHKEYDH